MAISGTADFMENGNGPRIINGMDRLKSRKAAVRIATQSDTRLMIRSPVRVQRAKSPRGTPGTTGRGCSDSSNGMETGSIRGTLARDGMPIYPFFFR